MSRLAAHHCVARRASVRHTSNVFAWLRELTARFRPPASPSAGDDAERRAAAWLERERRFQILARNWRSPRDRRDELDLVARDPEAEALVFVEVKSRPDEALVPGYFAAVKPRKRKAVLRAARAYIRALREKPRTVRYDVVEVATFANGSPPEVRHFENVPLFGKEFLRGR